ncbi:hypothetical protein TRFO_17300 [Tritrichomonas foetus]|uniref:Ubiquitin-like domain-containing protein n=1 Tax=Tritrichomonas foetus TaxID=1144522 RepID=A0A1J4KSH1_9EUKA|nr:hypothetical protein TRFO_17300 [Tritrichomonas foetus]|eukprot:OHT12756.1 hypothetical protein TRFO_17300 [Tritrichomonas foetus]
MHEFTLNPPTGEYIETCVSGNSTVRSLKEDICHRIKEPESNVKLSLSHRLRFLNNNAPLKSLGTKKNESITVTFEKRKLGFQYKNTAPIYIPLYQNSTIQNVKSIIAPHFQVSADKIILSYDSKIFEDNFLMRDIQIPYSKHINIELMNDEENKTIQNRISYLFMFQHEAYKFDFPEDATIGDAKEELMKLADPNTAEIKIRCGGIYFKDNQTKLTEMVKMAGGPGECIVVESRMEIDENDPYVDLKRISKIGSARRRTDNKKRRKGLRTPFDDTSVPAKIE